MDQRPRSRENLRGRNGQADRRRSAAIRAGAAGSKPPAALRSRAGSSRCTCSSTKSPVAASRSASTISRASPTLSSTSRTVIGRAATSGLTEWPAGTRSPPQRAAGFARADTDSIQPGEVLTVHPAMTGLQIWLIAKDIPLPQGHIRQSPRSVGSFPVCLMSQVPAAPDRSEARIVPAPGRGGYQAASSAPCGESPRSCC